VVIDCESCMQWHIEQAAAAGASAGERLEEMFPVPAVEKSGQTV